MIFFFALWNSSFTIIKSHLISFGLSLNISAPLTSSHMSFSRDLIFELSSEGLHCHKKTFSRANHPPSPQYQLLWKKYCVETRPALSFKVPSSTFVLLLEEKSNYTRIAIKVAVQPLMKME